MQYENAHMMLGHLLTSIDTSVSNARICSNVHLSNERLKKEGRNHLRGQFKCYVTLFVWKLDPHPLVTLITLNLTPS